MIKTIENVLDLGQFIDYNHSYGFVSELEEVKDKIDKLSKIDPEQAANLYEVFIAGCYEKADEIDDSDGSLGQFVEDLFCSWIKAHQAANNKPEDTINKLLVWMENDDYGFCYELWNEAVKYLNKKGLAAFRTIIEKRSLEKIREIPAKMKENQDHRQFGEIRDDIDMLKAIYREQKDIKSYADLCNHAGIEPKDCEVIADMFQTKGKKEEALKWVDRGIDLNKTDRFKHHSVYELEKTRRKLLKQFNRNDEALNDAWADYENHPSTFSYDELMKYTPFKEKDTWHKKAISILEDSSLWSAIEVYLKTKELDLLAERILREDSSDIKNLSHYTTQPAAEKLIKSHSLASAKLYMCHAFRIVESKKSKYYHIAHEHFQKVKELYEKEGLTKEWQDIVERVRADHSRKSSFIGEFERIASGKGLYKEPSFQEKINKRLKRYGQSR